MKVLLIAPPIVRMRYNIGGIYPLPPLGLAYIASTLEQHGFRVDILDIPALKMRERNLADFLKKNQFDIYGLSCTIFNLCEGIKVARMIKDINPASKIVLGGHCDAFSPEIIFKYGPDFDVLVRGEGEEAMLRLCNQWKQEEINRLNEINGISFRDNGHIINTPKTYYFNLEKISFPARHLLYNKRYRLHPPYNLYPPITLMETSRGCVYNCTFCSMRQPLRFRPISNIIDEIKQVIDKFGIREIRFVDCNFTQDSDRVMQLCDRLQKEKIKIFWSCESRVNPVSKNLLQRMYKTGCYIIAYGVEGGSQDVLDSLNKETTVGDIINAFRLTREAGIRTIAYFILGLPGENNATFRETLKLAKKIDPDYILYTELFPAPNSLLLRDIIRLKQISEENLADFYILRKDIFKRKTFTGQSKKRLRRWLFFATLSFYFRSKYIFLRLRGLKNIHELFNLINGVRFLILDSVNINLKYVFKR